MRKHAIIRRNKPTMKSITNTFALFWCLGSLKVKITFQPSKGFGC